MENNIFDDINFMKDVHSYASVHLHETKNNAIIIVTFCGLTILFSLGLLIRTFKIKEKGFFLLVITLIIIGLVGNAATSVL